MKHQSLIKNCFYFFFIISAAGCYYDKEELLYPGSNQAADCSTIAATFRTDVLPIITEKCASSGCHDASASGGVTLKTYLQISSVADRINATVVVGKTMPKSGTISQAQINIIKCWIDGGARDN